MENLVYFYRRRNCIQNFFKLAVNLDTRTINKVEEDQKNNMERPDRKRKAQITERAHQIAAA